MNFWNFLHDMFVYGWLSETIDNNRNKSLHNSHDRSRDARLAHGRDQYAPQNSDLHEDEWNGDYYEREGHYGRDGYYYEPGDEYDHYSDGFEEEY